MTEQDLAARLAGHKTLGAAPHAELAWLAAHGSIRKLDAGEILSAKGRPVEALYILLAGRLALFVDRGAGPDKVVEWRGGDVSGLLPFSRLTAPPGDSKALEPLEILSVPREHLRAMTQECFEVTSILVHSMVDRARLFTSGELLNEKMISLGKLSAGLAHELNNPASAIKRCAALMADRFKDSEAAARSLAAVALRDTEIAAIDAVCAATGANRDQPMRMPIEQSDREEVFAAWLSRHAANRVDAAALADTGVTIEALERLAASVQGSALDAALRWLAASCAIRNLLARIQDSAAQISNLVRAVKGFTHMDQANVAEPVDVSAGLADTVEILQAKARAKRAMVTLELEAGLPRVRGFAAELNQVWSNLIDNALDAVAEEGKVTVHANAEREHVVVRVVDDGAGIPAAIRDLIFDPFFTTKPMGQGVGLGLDIARRLVRHNEGAIEFESSAGRTEFRVTLPVAGRSSA